MCSLRLRLKALRHSIRQFSLSMGGAEAKPSEPAASMEETFSVHVSKLSGEGREFERLVPSMLLRELKEVVCEGLGVHSYQTQLMLDRPFDEEDTEKRIGELGIGQGAELKAVMCGFCRNIPGRWEPAREDNSDWMRGMTVEEDGTFTCKSGRITDGLVRLVSAAERKINFKRTCEDANDHVFVMDADGQRMRGRCLQSSSTYTLTKQPGGESYA